MDFMPRLFALISTVLFVVGVGTRDAQSPAPVTSTSTVVAAEIPPLSGSTSAPATTTSVYIIPPTARCGQWWGLASQVGWPDETMETLDYVMWRESRCDPSQHNTTLNRDGSSDVGLTQVNDRSWCLPTKWYPNGYLQTVGILSTVGCEQLFDPATNLRAAKEIYDYTRREGGQGFEAWGL